ncbi:hypothetical protein KM043_005906 [Ampulex compressa]|nr:hypothetical protein KM043_005906 [Ampulex compressa]
MAGTKNRPGDDLHEGSHDEPRMAKPRRMCPRRSFKFNESQKVRGGRDSPKGPRVAINERQEEKVRGDKPQRFPLPKNGRSGKKRADGGKKERGREESERARLRARANERAWKRS